MTGMDRAAQPDDGDERSIALGWLAFHRDALRAKCEGLTPEELVRRAAPPSHLSLLGLVRHLAEMEHAYGAWPLGGDSPFEWVWGTYEEGAEEDMDCAPDDVAGSFQTWDAQRSATDRGLAATQDLDHVGRNGRSLRWNLAKLIGEYARHNGHADLIRERIDGATGE